MRLKDIKLNPNNPRFIRDEQFKKLVDSIKDFPKMMRLRPIVVNSDMMILGGNMRFRACEQLGMNEIPDEWVKIADDLTPDEQRRFIIEDNVAFGQWDYDLLANDWDTNTLLNWGLEIPNIQIDLPDSHQSEPNPFDGFIIVMKVDSETFQMIKGQIDEMSEKYGIEVNIS